MRRGLRFFLIALGAIVAVAVLALGYFYLPDTNAERLSRRDMMLGVVTLGVLSLAAFGFDLRDWI